MPSRPNSPSRKRRWALLVPAAFAAIFLILAAASHFIDEPLRRFMENGMNQALKGYSARIEEVDFHLVGLSVTVKGLELSQDAHPDPPVALFPALNASIHWRELLSARLVADWSFDNPRLFINLQQLRAERDDETPVEKRGWQEAVKHIYPLRINRLTIRAGELTYIDQDPENPLTFSAVDLEAHNIQNIDSPGRTYPSPVRMTATVFESGSCRFEGDADVLKDPHPGIRGELAVRDLPLQDLKPLSARANLIITDGVLTARGELEYAPEVRLARLREVEVTGLRADYVHTAITQEAEKERAEKVREAASEAADEPGTLYRIDRLVLSGEAGWVNKAADPPYRIFLNEARLEVKNLSSRFREGPAEARLRGLFMGSGDTDAFARFRPEEKGADFDLALRTLETRLPAMNDLLRAYGDFDVTQGSFSLFSEISVGEGRIDGYVKPLFEEVDVYDPQQDEEKNLFQKIYEGIVGGVSAVLENEPREEVATVVDISGPLENPDVSTWQVVMTLIRNGFFDAILPGFERRKETAVGD